MPRRRGRRRAAASEVQPVRVQMAPVEMPLRLLEMVTIKAATSGLSRTAFVRRVLAREVGYDFPSKKE